MPVPPVTAWTTAGAASVLCVNTNSPVICPPGRISPPWHAPAYDALPSDVIVQTNEPCPTRLPAGVKMPARVERVEDAAT